MLYRGLKFHDLINILHSSSYIILFLVSVVVLRIYKIYLYITSKYDILCMYHILNIKVIYFQILINLIINIF